MTLIVFENSSVCSYLLILLLSSRYVLLLILIERLFVTSRSARRTACLPVLRLGLLIGPKYTLLLVLHIISQASLRSSSPCQISPLSGRSVGIQPIKLSKFGILFTASPSTSTRLHNFYEILGVCTRIWIAFKFLIWSLSGDKRPTYKHFPAVEAFSDKLSIAPTGETTDRIKQVRVQKWHESPLSPCQVWWGSWVARRLE